MINLNDFDFIVINSSGGKDSLCAIHETNHIIEEQKFDKTKVIISHQILTGVEWNGVSELAEEQAKLYGYDFHTSKRRNASGYEETLLEYIERRGKFPSRNQRYCTSDFKRVPGDRIVRAMSKRCEGDHKILSVFGFRQDESPARAKKIKFSKIERLSTKKRDVFEFLPIHDWTEERVWTTIKENKLPYHFAYDLGMPRLSCAFCIFAPLDALVISGKANPELLDKYIELEKKTGHTFRDGFSISSVKEAILEGYEPKKNAAALNWNM